MVELGELEGAQTPKEKLEVVMQFCGLLYNEVKKKDERTSADVLIPVLLLAVVKARPLRLVSDLRFVQRFRNHSHLTNVTAYNLTNLLAVMSVLEETKVDKLKSGESIYSLVSRSTTHIKLDEGQAKSQPSSPSMLMRPITEFNAMATNVFSKVTFYPRAISSAVAESFRSRSASKTMDELATLGWEERTDVRRPDTGEIYVEDEVLREFQQHVMQLEGFDDMTLKELPVLFSDYKKLLMTFRFKPAPKPPQ